MKASGLAAVAVALAAQVSLAQTPRPGTPTPNAPPATRAQVSVQPPAAADQRPPQLSRTETAYFDNWQTNCQEFVNPPRRQCSAVLQLLQTNPQTNSATLLISWVLTLADQQLAATIQTPTGVSIAPGIEVKVGKTVRKAAFARCDAQRCEGAFPIEDAFSRELAGAETAEVVITAIQGNVVTFNLPLKGYEKAVQALRR